MLDFQRGKNKICGEKNGEEKEKLWVQKAIATRRE